MDARTDVYSLGVVLYELLVGVLPLEFHRLALDEILRRMREEEAPRPSTKLRTRGEQSGATAQNRGSDTHTLTRQLRGDLDAIALKALEKERSRRYDSPFELAADIGRYLRHEPVSARPASAAYRARQYIRRHRPVIISGIAGAAILAIVGGILLYVRSNSAPVIKVFDVTPKEIHRGGKVAIRWEVANADDVELEPFGRALATGNTTDKPQFDTIYKLTATSKGGRKTGMFQEVIVFDPNSPKVENKPPEWRLDSPIPDVAGIWAEINPKDSPPLRLKIVQTGAHLAVYISYTQTFSRRALLETIISQGRATNALRQSCAAIFQHAGYNYDHPGVNTFNISLRGTHLVYEQETTWTSPCDGHPIGVERKTKELRRLSLSAKSG